MDGTQQVVARAKQSHEREFRRQSAQLEQERRQWEQAYQIEQADLDRQQNNFAAGSEAPGGFRLANRADGAGYIEMWVGGAGPSCADLMGQDNDDWLALTDPNFVDIIEFTITSNPFEGFVEEKDGSRVNQRTNEVTVAMMGQLQLDDRISRRIEDTIRVRNDFIWRSPAP